MKSFNQDLKSALVAEIRKHREQDQVIQGNYGTEEDGKFRGCAVGCAIDSLFRVGGHDTPYYLCSDHGIYERELGIPRILAELQDVTHEGLSDESFPTWPERFMEAVSTETDLSLVFPKFALWFLVDEEYGILSYAIGTKHQEAVEEAAGLLSAIVAGEHIPLQVWKDCAELARSVRTVGTPEDFTCPACAVNHILSAFNGASGSERRYLTIALDISEELHVEKYNTSYYEKCAEKLIELLKAEGNERI